MAHMESTAVPGASARMMHSTVLRLEGRDALTVLHAISTNALADLQPGGARATLFCDFRGRLQHRAVVAMTSDRAVWLLRDDASAGPLAAFIDRHVFREDLRVEDRSAALSVWVPAHDVALTAGTLAEHDGIPGAVRVDEATRLALGPELPAPAALADAPSRGEAGPPAPAHPH